MPLEDMMRSEPVFGAMTYVFKPLPAYQACLKGNPQISPAKYSYRGNGE